MSDCEMLSERYARLRRQAEQRIMKWPNFTSCKHADLPMVIHELKIHLAEQEIQNEELKRAIQVMEIRCRNKEHRDEFDQTRSVPGAGQPGQGFQKRGCNSGTSNPVS